MVIPEALAAGCSGEDASVGGSNSRRACLGLGRVFVQPGTERWLGRGQAEMDHTSKKARVGLSYSCTLAGVCQRRGRAGCSRCCKTKRSRLDECRVCARI